MFRTSRLQEIVKVPQVQVIDEVAKVPRSMRRQVLMIQEMQKDQKHEEVQISFKVYVDRVKDGQNDTPEPQKAGQGARFVLTSRAGRTKPKCRKTRTSVHKCKAKCKAPREKRVQTKNKTQWRHEREQSGSQTCRPVDQCTHTSLSRGVDADHEARSLIKRKTAARSEGSCRGLTPHCCAEDRVKAGDAASREESRDVTRYGRGLD